MITKDAISIGQFGFFKDPEMTMRLDDENLFDQMDADGTVDIWFGGRGVWYPDYGLFSVFIQSSYTFFWDILDENGNRTKTGFSEVQIPYNPRMKPYVGDLIPPHPEEVFDWTYDKPSVGDNQLICANLWFYNNYFVDEYYRYNLLILPKSAGPTWPNELEVRTTPMNDKLKIHNDEFIVGYRPKIEYMNQLAVLDTLVSGYENKILFRFKMDLNYLADNPTAKRTIRIFSMTGDNLQYTLYPNDIRDIIWRKWGRNFLNEYSHFIFEYGIMSYLPNDKLLDEGDKVYDKWMTSSNHILEADMGYQQDIARDMNRLLDGEDIEVAGYSELIREDFLTWYKENKKTDIPKNEKDILIRVIATRKYFKGFQYLSRLMGDEVGAGFILPKPSAIDADPIEEVVDIVKVDNVHRFRNNYTPNSAKGYLEPKHGYEYSGMVGTGFYNILVANRPVPLFCTMRDVSDGWMYLLPSYRVDRTYMDYTMDYRSIEDVLVRDEKKGLSWATNDGRGVQFYNMPFNVTGFEFSLDNTVDGAMIEVFTGSAGQVLKIESVNGKVYSYISGGVTQVYPDGAENVYIEAVGGTGEMNNLVIKMTSGINGDIMNVPFIDKVRIK